MSTIKNLSKKNFNKISPSELELIMADVIGKSKEYIIAHPEKIINNYQLAIINKNIKRRIKGEPLAYIFGEKEFYGLSFKVNKNVLVPRPETELMVEEALQHISRNTYHVTHNINRKTQNNIAIIDVGTGSGCIIITLARLLKSCGFIAVDISEKALATARQNAKLHKVSQKIKFLQSDLLSSILNSKFLIHNSSLIILANLPYLTPTQIKKSPSIKHEPKLALSAGPDGLKYYRKLLKQIRILFDSLSFVPHSHLLAILEIDPSQKNKIKSLIKKELPYAEAQIKKDLRGHSRIAVIELNNV